MTFSLLQKHFSVRYVLLLCLMAACLPLAAQLSWNDIKNNDAYLSGEGTGFTRDEADKLALARLISQISVSVSAATRQRAQQVTSAGGDARYEEITEDDIQTYSDATLTNTRIMIIDHDDAGWHVGRYIPRSELDTIFHARRAKVRDFMHMALKAESEGRAGDALRYYYWGLLLLETLPLPSSVTFDYEQQQQVLTVWIPERINSVLRDLKVEVVSREGMDIVLAFTYRGIPVNSIDYQYFDGHDMSGVCTARDGRGTMELFAGYDPKQLEIFYEITYAQQVHIDYEMAAVMQSRDKVHASDEHWRRLMGGWMRLAKAYVDPQPRGAEATADESHAAAVGFAATPVEMRTPPRTLQGSEAVGCQARMDRIIEAIRSGAYAGADDCFTPEGLDVFRRLIAYGRARLVGEPQLTFYPYRDETVCRGLQMSFSPPSNLRRSFVEDVVFSLDADGLVHNVAFGLGKTAEDDILNKGVWPEAARHAMMQFLENYKTAFALKRLDYIKTLFDDEALIITGTVLRPASTRLDENAMMQTGRDIIRYNRFSKDEYIRHLQHSFNSNEFINIRFGDNDVERSGEDVFGIQIAQDYYSTHYGDHGYLFLLVDMSQPDEPLIKVRTWQPERDPHFGIYNHGDF